MLSGQAMRMICKLDGTLSAAVCDDEVVLVRADPSDETQRWIQDHDNVGRLTDNQGRRAFALVNVATGKALVHHEQELQLAPYTGHDGVKISMLWSLSVQDDDGFSEIRDISNMDSTINAGNYCGEGKMQVGLFRYSRSQKEAYNFTVWKVVPITSA